MKDIRARLRHDLNRSDEGLTLIEILVAMMVFAIIAVGVAFSLTSSLTMVRDARAREVAANLAAQAIDTARSLENVFSVRNSVEVTPAIDGITYTVTQKTGWVSGGTSGGACGDEGAPLDYKHVNVTVSWSGMKPSTSAVRSDTLIAPNGRINDPDMGTILVSVTGASGVGKSGVTVAAAPAAIAPLGAETVDPVPLPTDSDGCSYVLKVVPGNYDITVSRPANDYVSEKQLATVTQQVGVEKGDSTSADFQFDLASAISSVFASNSAAVGIQFPSNLKASFLSENGVYVPAAPMSVPSSKTVVTKLHPYTNGYNVFAGAYVAPGGATASCLSPDPAAWSVPNAGGAVGIRAPSVASLPGVPATAPVPMGIVTVAPAKDKYLVAVSAVADVGTGDPGCTAAAQYTFPTKMGTTPVVIALPFGTWTLYSSSTSGVASGTRLKATELMLPAGSIANDTMFTLDPRLFIVP